MPGHREAGEFGGFGVFGVIDEVVVSRLVGGDVGFGGEVIVEIFVDI